MTQKPKNLQTRIVSGSIVLLMGSGLTTAINLAYNLFVARFLGPEGFGHATVVYTILTLISAVTLSFQLICAKAVAQQTSAEYRAASYRVLHQDAWICGVVVSLVLLLFQGGIAGYLNLPNSAMVAILAVGSAFYIPLGSRRGYIQGTYGFPRLAGNLVVEGVARLAGSFLLMRVGLGVEGVVAANALAVAIAFVAADPKLPACSENSLRLSLPVRDTFQAVVFFSGQVLINNSDIVLVKHFFSAGEAGLYAAVAMAGRVVFAFTSAIVNSMFPLVASTRDEVRRDLGVIATSLLLVVGVGSVLVLCLDITPVSIWKLLFGSGFQTAAGQNISHLLAIYAMTTIVYSLSVVIITFEMSYKISNTSWVQLVFSAVVIGAICRFHSSLEKVILVQLMVMGGLFVFVALPFLVESLTKEERLVPAQNHWRVRATRAVSEDEVIAEIVRSDFHSPAYEAFQQRLSDIVNRPNLNNTAENAKRRALLFLRHCALWQEIPAGTKWHEIEVGDSDLKQIRAFPRAHWRTIASGELSIVEIALAILTHRYVMEGQFLSKISSIRDQLREEKAMFSAVILIGRNERDPLTVLDGNHRLLAAMLTSPTRIKRLRFLCGFSPRMKECCWYNTNVANLLRYGTHVLARLVRNPEAEFRRSLEDQNSDHSVARVYDLGDQSYIADSDNLRS